MSDESRDEVRTGLSAGGHPLRAGAPVAVRARFDGSWVDGFEIVDAGRDGRGPYHLRRCGDDIVLANDFPADDLRPRTPSRAAEWDSWVHS